MKYWNYTLTIIIFLLGGKVPGAKAIHLSDLQYFPELDTVTITRWYYIDPNTVFLQSNQDFYRWTGSGWQRLALPMDDGIQVREIYPYDANRYVITYSPSEHYYHSNILYFDGMEWRSIPAKQPYKITALSFIDSVRFYAGGIWGSLIYYNGDSTRVLPTIPAANFSQLWVIAPETFYAMVVSEHQSLNKIKLMKYNNGIWSELAQLPRTTYMGFIWDADSGLIVSSKGDIYNLQNDRIQKLAIMQNAFIKMPFVIDQRNRQFYFWESGTFWKMDVQGRRKKLFLFPYFAYIMPVSTGYLILYNNHMFYYGRLKVGRPVSSVNLFFNIFYMGRNWALGMSLYESRSDKLWFYFTSPDRINQFLQLNERIVGGIRTYHISNIIFKTGLLEFEKQQGIYDGGLGFADLDNDGDRDAILFSLNGQSQFFENLGNDQFRNVTKEVGLNIEARISKVEFVDFDLNGYVDIVFNNEVGSSIFVRNRGFWRLEDVSDKLSLGQQYKTYLPAFADLDGDGDADVILYSIYGPIRYFENMGLNSQQLPVFVERSDRSPQMTRDPFYFTQSVSFADFDSDGRLDILLVNRNSPLKLFKNIGNFHFQDVTRQTGLHYRFLAYGADWGDLDTDGDLDLVLGTLGRNYIFWNQQGDSFKIDSTTFIDNTLSYTTGTLVADLDQDGDLDVGFANYLIGSDRIYINTLEKPSYLIIKVRGGAGNNKEGLGCTVRLYQVDTTGTIQKLVGVRYLKSQTGYNAYKIPEAFFGVENGHQYKAEVLFPNGRRIQMFHLQPGNRYQVQEVSGMSFFLYSLITSTKEWFFRENKRIHIYRFLAFMIVFLGFNLLIRLRSYWPVIHVLFFNTVLFSFYLLLDIMVFTLNPTTNWFVPFYLVFLAGWVTYYAIERFTTYKYGTEFRYELFDLFRQFHHSKNGLAQINHLVFFCNNLKVKENPVVLREFLKELHYFRMFSLPFIRSVLKMATRLRVTRENAHQASGLLKHIEHQVNQLYFLSGVSPKDLELLKSRLLQLKNVLLQIRKQTELAVSCDVVQVITQTLRRYPELTEVKFLRPPGVTIPRGIIPDEVLARVLGDILQNALEAMQNQLRKKVDVQVKQMGDDVEILVTDYGPGIDPTYQSRIFDAQFSTKQSTGLGLYHARRLLEKYGGKIQLVASIPGKGTTFKIYIKGVTHG